MKKSLMSILIILAIFIVSSTLMFSQSSKSIDRRTYENDSEGVYRITFYAYGAGLIDKFTPSGHVFVEWYSVKNWGNDEETIVRGFSPDGLRDDSQYISIADYSLTVEVNKNVYEDSKSVINSSWSGNNYSLGDVDCVEFGRAVASFIPNFKKGNRSAYTSFMSDTYTWPVGFLKYIIKYND